MRVHSLEIEAFGPFAGRERVDFDGLSQARLFLLHGPTGAGKTSVLDALVFGLYGEVPGARQQAGDLRSHHADPGLAPRVVLEVTMRGHRYRITRTARWERPKRRGTGTTVAQASVTLERWDRDAWTHLSSRIDETAQLVRERLGLTAAQFCQVVLLPQGAFADFLRSDADARRGLLQQIFDTARFAAVERWLVEHRQGMGARSRELAAQVRITLGRISETVEEPGPEWEGEALEQAAADGGLAAHLDRLLVACDLEAARADAQLASLRDRSAAAELAVAEARSLRAEVVRGRAARATLDRLAAEADEDETDRAALAAARRAAPVAALDDVARAAAAEAEAADRRAAESLAAASLHAHADGTEVDRAHEHALVLRERADRLRRTERDLAAARDRLTETRRQRESLVARLDASTRALERSPDLVRLLEQRLAVQRPIALAAPAREAALAQARAAVEGSRAAAARAAELDEAVAALDEAEGRSRALHEAWLDLRERRIQGMAAELAADLAVGGGCPVCGSVEHPRPATPDGLAVTAEAEDLARRAHEDASIGVQAAQEARAAARSRLTAALEQSGGLTVARAEHGVRAADEALASARAARQEVEGLEEQIADQQRAADRHEREAVDARARLEETEHRLAAADEQTEGLAAEIGAALGEHLDAASLLDHQTSLVGALSRARADLDARAVTRAAAEEARRRAVESARTQGFADVAAARAAHLGTTRAGELETRIAARAADGAAARALWEDLGGRARALVDAGEAPPDVDALTAARREAGAALDEGTGRLDRARRRSRRLSELADQVRAHLAAWGPVHADAVRAAELAACVEGKGPDNPWQMRLSAYVLAARLGQVVAAANERLAHMAGQRYQLEHSAAREAGNRRGGLALRVLDAWTGDARDPATLSGGESFMVSLALALGLADVVAHEAGGAEIETLFVDEGFGSLDEDTLDRVMDCLEQLRSGGRAVGLVSHVAELRTRIPDQLRVVIGEHGSRLESRGTGVTTVA